MMLLRCHEALLTSWQLRMFQMTAGNRPLRVEMLPVPLGSQKAVEAITLNLQNAPYDGALEYRTHVSDYGWQGYVKEGKVSGTTGQSKSVQAIQIRLTGEMANHYDVYYRAHVQDKGWLGWACNDQVAGTTGFV